MALHTLTDVKEFLSIENQDYDSFLEDLIVMTDQVCKNYCRRDLESTTYTNYDMDGSNSHILQLPQYPVSTLTSVYDDVNRTFGSNTLISSSDYIVDTNRGQVIYWQGGVWVGAIRNIRVTYTAGYSVGSANYEAISHSCVLYTSHQFKLSNKGGGRFGISGVNLADGSVSLFEVDAIPKEVKKTWDYYKRKDMRFRS